MTSATAGSRDGVVRHTSPGEHDSPVVNVEGVTKAFGSVAAVRDVTFQVQAGEIFALIGPSGSGKTTLVGMLVGQSLPTEGEVQVQGVAPAEFTPTERAQIGYVPQQFVLYPNLSVEQNARFSAGLYGMGLFSRRRRVREVLSMLDLWDARRRPAKSISGGMRRRLSLACALIHRPSLLVIDEPTAGLDPILREQIWEQLKALQLEGVTIVVTTQYLEEAVQCDRVGLMRGGDMIALGSPQELRERAFDGVPAEIETDGHSREDVEVLSGTARIRHVEPNGWSGLRITMDSPEQLDTAVKALEERGIQVRSARLVEPSFDEVFIRLVQAEEPAE